MSLVELSAPRRGRRKGEQNHPKPTQGEFIRGARAIAHAIGDSLHSTYHRLEDKRIPGAKKDNGTWTLHLPSYRASFTEQK